MPQLNTSCYDGYGRKIIDKNRIKKRNYIASNVNVLLTKVPDKTLKELGRYVASTDFSVRFYFNKKHPGFYKNRELLEKAI